MEMEMTNTVETNKAVVLAVSRVGCTVAVNGRNADITWGTLAEASTQDEFRGQSIDETTREFARFYRSIQAAARAMVAHNQSLPISYAVQQDGTNVRCVAVFRDVTGASSWIPRAADEGGAHDLFRLAQSEAEARAARLRGLGYCVVNSEVRP